MDFLYSLNASSVYELTAVKDGYTILRENYLPSIITDVGEPEDGMPLEFSLGQNYPNPFNPSTVIEYSLSARTDVIFEIFNILSQKVYEQNWRDEAPAKHYIEWDGKDQNGQEMPSGVYLYRLTAGESNQTKKMILLR